MAPGAHAAILLASLVVILPSVSAGTAEKPELSDPAGDWKPEIPETGPVQGSRADLLSFWIEEDTPSALNVTLQVARLEEGQEGYFGVLWNAHPLHERWGVQATPSPSGYTYHLTDGTGRYPPREVQEVKGETHFGSPGTIHWEIPKSAATGVPGTLLRGFWAESEWSLNGLSPFRDQAQENTSRWAVGWAQTPTFEVPQAQAPLNNTEEQDPPAGDLQAAWITFESNWINVTFQVRDLSPASVSQCATAASLPDRRASFSVVLTDRETVAGAVDVASDGAHLALSEPPRFRWEMRETVHHRIDLERHSLVAGSPGYVRISLPRNHWNGTEDLNLMDVSLSAKCGNAWDKILYEYDEAEIPAASFLVALAAMVAVSRRR